MRLHVESTTASQPERELAGERGGAVGVDGDALPQLDGRLAVRDADEGEPHEAKWVSGRTADDEQEADDEQHREAAAAETDLAPQDQPGRRHAPRSRA